MARQKPTGLLLNGSMKQSGVTFYLRNGKMVARSAHTNQPKRRTRTQFISRQQLAHSSRLWALLKAAGEPMFAKTTTSYNRFMSLMRRTPVVFLPQRGALANATLLLPDMPVSDGVLPVVEQHLGTVNGQAALITSLTKADIHRHDSLRLYTLSQHLDDECPSLQIKAVELTVKDFQRVDGRLALVSDDFADDMAGWALVHIRGINCSSQSVVTRCTCYEQFTTEEALLAAAATYGGLTKEV